MFLRALGAAAIAATALLCLSIGAEAVPTPPPGAGQIEIVDLNSPAKPTCLTTGEAPSGTWTLRACTAGATQSFVLVSTATGGQLKLVSSGECVTVDQVPLLRLARRPCANDSTSWRLVGTTLVAEDSAKQDACLTLGRSVEANLGITTCTLAATRVKWGVSPVYVAARPAATATPVNAALVALAPEVLVHRAVTEGCLEQQAGTFGSWDTGSCTPSSTNLYVFDPRGSTLRVAATNQCLIAPATAIIARQPCSAGSTTWSYDQSTGRLSATAANGATICLGQTPAPPAAGTLIGETCSSVNDTWWVDPQVRLVTLQAHRASGLVDCMTVESSGAWDESACYATPPAKQQFAFDTNGMGGRLKFAGSSICLSLPATFDWTVGNQVMPLPCGKGSTFWRWVGSTIIATASPNQSRCLVADSEQGPGFRIGDCSTAASIVQWDITLVNH